MSLVFHLLDVGQGECVIVDFPDDSFAVFDGGPRSDARDILPAIASRAGRRCRFVTATQWDRDHIAGLPRVVDEARPELFMTPSVGIETLERIMCILDGSSPSPIIDQIRMSCDRVGADEQRLGRGQALPLRGLPLVDGWVLGPPVTQLREIERALRKGGHHDDLSRFRNAASMAAWFRYGGRTAFLSGEQGGSAWLDIHDYCRRKAESHGLPADPRSDWIKLSHHGSERENNGELFQYLAQPAFVASASSSGTRYGHPHPRALANVVEAGGRAMCTRLGQGCKAIHDHKHDPMRPDTWARGVSRFPIAGTPCHGTVTVVLGVDGVVKVSGMYQQLRCPYGAPPDGVLEIQP